MARKHLKVFDFIGVGILMPELIEMPNRVNISDVLKYTFGPSFAPDPKMLKLMELNGNLDPRFLTGAEEAAAFKRKEFIRMNSSTISKVEFFRFVLERASKGKLKNSGRSLPIRMDRALDSRPARIVALVSAIIGLPAAAIGFLSLF